MKDECHDIRERLVDVLARDLPAEESAYVEHHVAGCAECRRYRDALDSDDRRLDAFAASMGGLASRIQDGVLGTARGVGGVSGVLVAGTDDAPAGDAGTSDEVAEAERPVVTTGRAVDLGRPPELAGEELVVSARIMNRHFPMRFLRNLIGTQVVDPPLLVEAGGDPDDPNDCNDPRTIDIDCFVRPVATLGNAERGGFVPALQRPRTLQLTVETP